MADTWGGSWGTSWGGSWGSSGPAPVVVSDGVIPSGGIPAPETRDLRPFDERDPYRFSRIGEARKIIAQVAIEQVQDLHLDAQQRFEQLTRELELREIEFEARHLEMLNQMREQLIEMEIKDLFRTKDDEEAMLLILIAANLT